MSREKPVFRVFDQVRHKPGCTVTTDGKRLEISDFGRRGIVLLCKENKGSDQLRGYHAADLRLCFHISKSRFFHDVAHLIPV